MFETEEPGPGYALAWPGEVFVGEAKHLLRRPASRDLNDQVALLLEEAFDSDEPRDEFTAAAAAAAGWSTTAAGVETPARSFLISLIHAVDRLPGPARTRAYYPERAGRARAPLPATWLDQVEAGRRLQVDWIALVHKFATAGYLQRAAGGKDCVDDRHDVDAQLARTLEEQLGLPGLWPLMGGWDSDLFYGLIEAVGDLLQRPRSRWAHNFSGCGWHYDDFAAAPARALYRAAVNPLLDRHKVDLRLSTDGEDTGLLVQVTGDARDDLVERLVTAASAEVEAPARHAIALFRKRDATTEERRSAVVVLAGILESRRALLKTDIGSKDEGDLFNIANNFALRHRNKQQQEDYRPVFLDWIFWWYLATVDLTDQQQDNPTTTA